jgi:hypothetical protein
MDPVYFYGYLSPTVSAFIVFGVALAGFGLLTVFGVSQWRIHHKRWKRLLEEEQRPLAPGIRNITGKIHPIHDPLPTITTNEFETDIFWDGRRLTRWKELSKTRSVAPFQIKTQSGEEVRVEVSDQSLFRMYTPAQCSEVVYKKRTRSHAFQPGDEVWVRGELISNATGADAPFREAANPWVMQPPRGAFLYAIQTAQSKFQKKLASFYLGWASVLGVIYVICLALCMPYVSLLCFGQKVTITPTSLEITKNSAQESYEVAGWYSPPNDEVTGSQEVIVGRVFAETARQLDQGTLQTLPGLAAPAWLGFKQLGDIPSLSQNEALLLLLGLLMLSCLVVVSEVLYQRMILIRYHNTGETHTA